MSIAGPEISEYANDPEVDAMFISAADVLEAYDTEVCGITY
ncbi:MAG: hypothetical protein R2695_21135 [Acidimicrobiales bacterium]